MPPVPRTQQSPHPIKTKRKSRAVADDAASLQETNGDSGQTAADAIDDIPDDSVTDTRAHGARAPPRLWTVDTVLAFFGGEKPIDISTLYRGVRSGRYPKPVNVGGVRWLADECEAAFQRMLNERDGRKRIETRGRKRRIPPSPADAAA